MLGDKLDTRTVVYTAQYTLGYCVWFSMYTSLSYLVPSNAKPFTFPTPKTASVDIHVLTFRHLSADMITNRKYCIDDRVGVFRWVKGQREYGSSLAHEVNGLLFEATYICILHNIRLTFSAFLNRSTVSPVVNWKLVTEIKHLCERAMDHLQRDIRDKLGAYEWD